MDNDSPSNSPTVPPSTSSSGPDEEVRIVFLGSAKSGKTSIIQRFLYNRFDMKYIPTVEDIHMKKYIVHNYLIKLILIDTAGSYDFPAMLRLCINKASAFVLVFAHDNIESLNHAGRLLNQIKSQRKDYAPLNTNYINFSKDIIYDMNIASPPIVVVCNKSDLPNSHSQITEGTIMEWLLTNSLKPSQFVYSSAKTNESILSIFKSLWLQNNVSKAIKLVRWEGVRRASFNNQSVDSLTNTHSHSHNNNNNYNINVDKKETDFSALTETMTNHNFQNQSQIENVNDKNNGDKIITKTRSSIFRNSLRLSRRSSGKSSKCKPDLVHLDCVLS